MRFRRHRHDWRLVGEQFNPPVHLRLKNATQHLGQIVAFGFTVVTYQCSGCPQRRFEQVVGRTADAS